MKATFIVQYNFKDAILSLEEDFSDSRFSSFEEALNYAKLFCQKTKLVYPKNWQGGPIEQVGRILEITTRFY